MSSSRSAIVPINRQPLPSLTAGQPLYEDVRGHRTFCPPESALGMHLAALNTRTPQHTYASSRSWLLAHAALTHDHLIDALLHVLPSAGRAAEVLGLIGDPRAVAALAQALHTAPSAAVRDQVGRALARHPAPEARSVQMHALVEGSAETAKAIILGLDRASCHSACLLANIAAARTDFDAAYYVSRARERCGCFCA